MSPRHAVYWVPCEEHPLWQAGCRWLAAGDHRAAPRRYGFHATVKAPMALRGTESAFAQRLSALAARHAIEPLPRFEVTWLRDFMALRPAAPLPAGFRALADACVTELDDLRAPAGPHDVVRRTEGLDDEHRALCERWGYPHVLHRWQMHLTLTDAIVALPLREALQAQAEGHFAEALARPTGPGELAWCVERAPGEPFQLLQRFPLGGVQ